MITHILLEADWDPTVMIGGNLPAIGGNGHRVGHGDTMVLESCEYCDSFLNFSPSMSIILNIEADHLDYFKDLAHIQRSFREFAELSSDSILINGDDENTVEAVKGLEYHTFGLAEGNQIRAVNLSADWRSFDVECDGKFYCHVDISVLGKHNTLNALASAAAAYLLGIDGEAVSRGIHAYRGAGRRLEFKGHLNGADVYDDYAHHPKEVQVTLAAAREMGYKRLVAVFQPHTYSRTQALFDDFVRELKKADFVIVSEIYAAREKNTLGITGRTMAEAIPGAVFCETLPEVSSYMRCIAQEGDMMITLGCGDIYRAADALFA
jgi:UDP-N-acetylmuramate--alanine ligase